jgi:predicted TIM-barrel fold metal-dependent hydrolase
VTVRPRRTGADVRAEVGHPVIDADGHTLELLDAAHPHLREALGPRPFQRWLDEGSPVRRNQAPRTLAERQRDRAPQGAWWGTHTADVLDRATATLPALLHSRMDELGLDVTVLYPTSALTTCGVEDDEMRVGLCAGFNAYYADVFAGFGDRLIPAGMIPMHTPDEAIAELRHCAALGLRAVAFPEGVSRPMAEPAGPTSSTWLHPGQTHWFDTFGLDSAHDYDPVWATAAALGYAVTFHGGLSVRPGTCTSISSYCANHIGMFSRSMEPLCRALFLGGATRRNPQVAFAFLECGVSWAVQLLIDTIEHWEKRRADELWRFDPARLDRDRLAELFQRHGGRVAELLSGDVVAHVHGLPIHGSVPEQPDEWAALGVSTEQEIAELFTSSFFFGCEADDRGICSAFAPWSPAPLRPVFSSDIGHWDVTEMATVVAESHALVTHGLLDPTDWRRFVFDHPAELFLRANPRFFDGTPVAAHLAPPTGAGDGQAYGTR